MQAVPVASKGETVLMMDLLKDLWEFHKVREVQDGT
jgi:hypothetical protein